MSAPASLVTLLRDAQRSIAEHPRVTAAVISAFVAEGRRFAATDEGRRCRQALLRSERFHRAQLLWDAFGLDRFAKAQTQFSPLGWVRTFVAATASDALESALSKLLTGASGAP
jgi:hypothetical protein